jgi:hypothetical protein
MSAQPRSIGALACLVFIVASSASPLVAQQATKVSPWAVSLVPTMNPLPIGSCGAVWLTLKDSTGQDAPRNPAGNRVTLADFDLSVAGATPLAVASAYNGPTNWSVCGCQGAKVGSSAVVTASYPKKSLSQAARVKGVTITQTATFKLRRRMGVSDPPACTELKAAAASARVDAKRSR